MAKPIYNRVLLKLSGEALSPPDGSGIDAHQADILAQKVKMVRDLDIQVALVIGGGNLWRGMEDGAAHGMERARADHMGMLATVMNALAVADALGRHGIETRVQTAIEMRAVAEPYIRGKAISGLEKGRVILLAAGTGNPYFSTDTAGALRAMEIDADVLIKATKVDGIYDKDPVKYDDAKRIDQLTYIDYLNHGLQAMDSTAITLCMDNNLPIVVLNLWHEDSIKRAVLGEKVGTLICS